MPPAHPNSIRGRLLRADGFRLSTGILNNDDPLLLVAAADEIERLTAELAKARRRLKEASRGAERLSLQMTLIFTERVLLRNEQARIRRGAAELDALAASGELTPEVIAIVKASPVFQAVIRHAQAASGPSPGVSTPLEAEKAAKHADSAPFDQDSLHTTTP